MNATRTDVTLVSLSALRVHWKLVARFAARDLQSRYRGSIVGGLWMVLQPLLLLGIFTFVFAQVLRVRLGQEVGTESFALFLFCGMLPWQGIQEGLTRASTSVLEQPSLVKRTIFPLVVLPLPPTVAALVQQGIATLVLGIILLVTGHPVVSPALLLLPFVVACQWLLTAGLGWGLAAAQVYIRDVGTFLGSALTVWVFLTPIFYPASLYPQGLAPILRWNPLALLVEAYRDILLRGMIPDLLAMTILAAVGLAIFVGGHALFKRLAPGFADLL